MKTKYLIEYNPHNKYVILLQTYTEESTTTTFTGFIFQTYEEALDHVYVQSYYNSNDITPKGAYGLRLTEGK